MAIDIEEIIRMLDVGVKSERIEAARMIAEEPSEEAIPVLKKAVYDHDPGVRYFAKKALGSLEKAGHKVPKDVDEYSDDDDTEDSDAASDISETAKTVVPEKANKKDKSKIWTEIKKPKKIIVSGDMGPGFFGYLLGWIALLLLFMFFGFILWVRLREWSGGLEIVLQDRIGQSWLIALLLTMACMIFTRRFFGVMEALKIPALALGACLLWPAFSEQGGDFLSLSWPVLANLGFLIAIMTAILFWIRAKKILFFIMAIAGGWLAYAQALCFVQAMPWFYAVTNAAACQPDVPEFLSFPIIAGWFFWPVTAIAVIAYLFIGPFTNSTRFAGDIFSASLILVAAFLMLLPVHYYRISDVLDESDAPGLVRNVITHLASYSGCHIVVAESAESEPGTADIISEEMEAPEIHEQDQFSEELTGEDMSVE